MMMRTAPRHPTQRPRRGHLVRWTLAVAAVTSLACAFAGCGSTPSDSEFNNIIPKIMEQAAGQKPGDVATELFNTTSPDAHRAAISFFVRKPWGFQEPYIRAYRTLATDPSAMVRGQAMRALGASKRSDVADALVKGLNDKDALVRQDAAAALKDVKNPIAIPDLLLHLKADDDPQVRINCAAALNGYRDPRVLRGLAEVLDDMDVAVAGTAFRSLKDTTGVQDLPADAPSAIRWVDQHYPQTPKNG